MNNKSLGIAIVLSILAFVISITTSNNLNLQKERQAELRSGISELRKDIELNKADLKTVDKRDVDFAVLLFKVARDQGLTRATTYQMMCNDGHDDYCDLVEEAMNDAEYYDKMLKDLIKE